MLAPPAPACRAPPAPPAPNLLCVRSAFCCAALDAARASARSLVRVVSSNVAYDLINGGTLSSAPSTSAPALRKPSSCCAMNAVSLMTSRRAYLSSVTAAAAAAAALAAAAGESLPAAVLDVVFDTAGDAFFDDGFEAPFLPPFTPLSTAAFAAAASFAATAPRNFGER